MSRRAHKPTDEQRRTVEALAGYGIPQVKISHVIGITAPTLEKYYRKELERGASVVEANLVSNLMRLARGSDGTALKAIMFSLQARFGWSPYAPPPAREEPIGKKQQLVIEAQTAHEDTEWGSILN